LLIRKCFKNRKKHKKSEKIGKNKTISGKRCLDFPKILTSLKIVAYKPLLIKETRCRKIFWREVTIPCQMLQVLEASDGTLFVLVVLSM